MAAVPITLVGIATDDQGTARNVTFVGMASLTGLGVGGGPIVPPDGGGGGGEPPGTWPPQRPPHPAHPIVTPPPEGGGGPPGGGEPPVDTVPGGDKPPPQGQAGWGYVAQWSDGTPGGWGFFPASSDKPNPPSIDQNK